MISLNDVYFKYTEQFIIEKCRVEFVSPGIHTIIGPNCSGKSTLMDIISTLKRPFGGSLLINGINPFLSGKALNTVRGLVSYMPSSIVFPHRFMVGEILEFWLGSKINKDMLNFVSLSNYINKKIFEISDGMKIRLGLVLAFCKAPIVLLDEPLRSQDEDLIHVFPEFIKRFSCGKTVVITSPVNIPDLENSCRYMLQNGGVYIHD